MRKKLMIVAAALMTLAPIGACGARRVVVSNPHYVGVYRPF